MDDLAQKYAIQQEIEFLLDEHIIQDIRNLAQNKSRLTLGNAQFAGLLNITRETDSVQVMLTWLRYQVGRYPAWQQDEFGKKLLTALENLRTDAEHVLEKVGVKKNDPEYRRLLLRVWRMLIRQYVGHLRRAVMAES